MYLSSHPLDDYEVVIKRYCNTQLTQFANLNDLRDKDFTIAGMVTDVQNLYTRTANPSGVSSWRTTPASTNSRCSTRITRISVSSSSRITSS